MISLKGFFLGLVAGFATVTLAGAMIGGFGRAAPCGYAKTFAEGAFFGAIMFGVLLGPPASLIACVPGGILGWFLERARLPVEDRADPRGSIGLLMGIIGLLGLVFAWFRMIRSFLPWE